MNPFLKKPIEAGKAVADRLMSATSSIASLWNRLVSRGKPTAELPSSTESSGLRQQAFRIPIPDTVAGPEIPQPSPVSELLGLEAEVRRLKRERTLARAEQKLWSEIASNLDVDLLDLFLRRLVPQPTLDFAGLWEVTDRGSVLLASRGWQAADQTVIGMEERFVKDLIRPKAIPKEQIQSESIGLTGLSRLNAGEWSELFAIPLGHNGERGPSADMKPKGEQSLFVLLTTSLHPPGLTTSERLAWVERCGRRLMQLWCESQARNLERRSLQFASTKLELRGLAEVMTDHSLEKVTDFLDHLRINVHADRATLVLLRHRVDDDSHRYFDSGPPLSLLAQSKWKELAETLTERTLSELKEASPAFGSHPDSAEAVVFDSDQFAANGMFAPLAKAIVIPLVVEGRVHGVLLLSFLDPHPQSKEESELGCWSAQLLARSIHRMLHDAAIRRLASHDGLTDLVNRRTFDVLLAGEVDRVRQGLSHEASLLLADIDHFKRINDTHGHLAGDAALRAVSHVLRTSIGHMRAGERCVLARYGGEEFAVLLPEVGLAGAARIAEEIRSAIESTPIPFANTTLFVTASLGAASCPRHGMTPHELVDAADKCLYRAKSEGRNRVCLDSA